MSDVRRRIRCCRRVTVLPHTRGRQRHFNTQSPAWISDEHLSEHFILSSFFFTVFSSVCLCFMFTLLACFFFFSLSARMWHFSLVCTHLMLRNSPSFNTCCNRVLFFSPFLCTSVCVMFVRPVELETLTRTFCRRWMHSEWAWQDWSRVTVQGSACLYSSSLICFFHRSLVWTRESHNRSCFYLRFLKRLSVLSTICFHTSFLRVTSWRL